MRPARWGRLTRLARPEQDAGPGSRPVPSWAVLSSVAAPVLLIGGWTLAAGRQPSGFNPVTDTISALAARDAADRWLMTWALAGVGCCHVVTALGLRPAGRPGRVVLAGGGLATVLVAAGPLPGNGGTSAGHTTAASLSFGALAAWPALAARRDPQAPDALRPTACAVATATLLALVGWFLVELPGGTRVGLAERAAAGAQALWPLAVVAASRRRPASRLTWAGRRAPQRRDVSTQSEHRPPPGTR
ncbi:MAG TPA: DUF998 domain-containing protein [Mycobacteriales bacterium]|nr:DUF998 domain-containing protein [Mycobacteriales bacterium]